DPAERISCFLECGCDAYALSDLASLSPDERSKCIDTIKSSKLWAKPEIRAVILEATTTPETSNKEILESLQFLSENKLYKHAYNILEKLGGQKFQTILSDYSTDAA